MGTRGDAYVDTSALVAFADRSDSYNDLFRRLFACPPSLFTTTLVVAEGHAWFLRRYDRYRALHFLSMVEVMSPLRIVGVSSRDQTEASKILRRFSDQDLTLTDALGLHLMEVQGTEVCWSTDRHLGLGGVPLVIHRH